MFVAPHCPALGDGLLGYERTVSLHGALLAVAGARQVLNIGPGTLSVVTNGRYTSNARAEEILAQLEPELLWANHDNGQPDDQADGEDDKAYLERMNARTEAMNERIAARERANDPAFRKRLIDEVRHRRNV